MSFEKFVKKTVSVDVIQYQGVIIECLKNDTRIKWSGDGLPDNSISIATIYGNDVCYKGDYIIKGFQGELYTCCAKSFEADYEKAPQRKKRTPKIEANSIDDVFENEAD